MNWFRAPRCTFCLEGNFPLTKMKRKGNVEESLLGQFEIAFTSSPKSVKHIFRLVLNKKKVSTSFKMMSRYDIVKWQVI